MQCVLEGQRWDLPRKIARAKGFIPLCVAQSRTKYLLTHPRYRMRDTVELAAEARRYARLQIGTRELAIAILLSRDERDASLRKRENYDAETFKQETK